MSITKHIPNAITCMNLLCGCLAVMAASSGDPLTAAVLIIAGAAFDFMDGLVARLLNVASPIGKELDSLADVVTFGLAPGMVLLHYLTLRVTGSSFQALSIGTDSGLLDTLIGHPVLFIPMLIPIFAALRLAKFNVDERQAMGFHGLPVPANALWCISIPLIDSFTPRYLPFLSEVFVSQWFIIGSSIGLSALMVSDIPLMAMKFKDFSWENNRWRYDFLISAVLLLIILQAAAFPFIILLYVLISIVHNKVNKA